LINFWIGIAVLHRHGGISGASLERIVLFRRHFGVWSKFFSILSAGWRNLEQSCPKKVTCAAMVDENGA